MSEFCSGLNHGEIRLQGGVVVTQKRQVMVNRFIGNVDFARIESTCRKKGL